MRLDYRKDRLFPRLLPRILFINLADLWRRFLRPVLFGGDRG